MSQEYEYPLIDGFSVDEIVILTDFYQSIEEAYENSSRIPRPKFMTAYNAFKRIIPSKMEQRQLEREFKEQSGYDAFQVIKTADRNDNKIIKVYGVKNGN